MTFVETPLKGCYIVELNSFSDSRGWFARTFCSEEFKSIGFDVPWVQHNHSFTKTKGSIRGMHYQKMPAGEEKLIRCISGKVYDVAIDLRVDSQTFLQWHAVELSAENRKMIFIPKGFAHGFQTLTENAELIYCHSEPYQPEYEAGVNYLDKQLNIVWPLGITEVSDRDKEHPFINTNFEGVNIK
jgi:dTDP-4-dehydrorhamnose 3,5-epimerase